MERRPPKVLADFAWYQDGVGMIGLTPKIKLPSLDREVEEYIAGGMAGTMKIDMGAVTVEDLEVTLAEPNIETIKLFGLTNGHEKQFVFRSAMRGTSGVDKFVIKVQGRVIGLDLGEIERKKLAETTCKITWTAYTIENNGEEILKVDLISGIERVGGADLRADINKALGIA
ncbi:phage major tail tube protein [Vibrio mangrovi]|uniref:Phage major tail tube protein n=1 Tax=Vibrio mangrovi TaxID=474394 RepID=A0A1Y6IWY4_9VIBR|nr:phage major tail tube protein [Vibrio mangrovi]MDW6004711.1 phage major tail tube protein [Vibrio mangrovi]SMS01002.1 Phage tail tube protein FII [Vibrio mangrovi]